MKLIFIHSLGLALAILIPSLSLFILCDIALVFGVTRNQVEIKTTFAIHKHQSGDIKAAWKISNLLFNILSSSIIG